MSQISSVPAILYLQIHGGSFFVMFKLQNMILHLKNSLKLTWSSLRSPAQSSYDYYIITLSSDAGPTAWIESGHGPNFLLEETGWYGSQLSKKEFEVMDITLEDVELTMIFSDSF